MQYPNLIKTMPQTVVVKLTPAAVTEARAKAQPGKFSVGQSNPTTQAQWILSNKTALIAEMAGEDNGVILSPDTESATLATDSADVKLRKLIQSCVVKSVHAARDYVMRNQAAAVVSVNAALVALGRLLNSGYSLHRDTRDGGELLVKLMNGLRIAVASKVAPVLTQAQVNTLVQPLSIAPVTTPALVIPTKVVAPLPGAVTPTKVVAPLPGAVTPTKVVAPLPTVTSTFAPPKVTVIQVSAVPILTQAFSGQNLDQAIWLAKNKTRLLAELTGESWPLDSFMADTTSDSAETKLKKRIHAATSSTIRTAEFFLEERKDPQGLIAWAKQAAERWDALLEPQVSLHKDIRNMGVQLVVFCRKMWAATQEALTKTAREAALIEQNAALAKAQLQAKLVQQQLEQARLVQLEVQAKRDAAVKAAEAQRQAALALAAAKTQEEQRVAQANLDLAAQLTAQQASLAKQAEDLAAQQALLTQQAEAQAQITAAQVNKANQDAADLAAQQEVVRQALLVQAAADTQAANTAAQAVAEQVVAEQLAAEAAVLQANAQTAQQQAQADAATKIAADAAFTADQQDKAAQQAASNATSQAQVTQQTVTTATTDTATKGGKIPVWGWVAGGAVAVILLASLMGRHK